MTRHEIDILLEKFYAGATDIDGERRLKAYFATADCPPELEADRRVVLGPDCAAAPPAGFGQRLAAAIRPRRPRRLFLNRMRAIAAAVAAVAIIGGGIYCYKRQAPTVYANTCETPEEAANETREILLSISRDMNSGLDAEEDLGGPCP